LKKRTPPSSAEWLSHPQTLVISLQQQPKPAHATTHIFLFHDFLTKPPNLHRLKTNSMCSDEKNRK
jgi:hypothetical protein